MAVAAHSRRCCWTTIATALATAMEEAARELRRAEHPLLHPEEPLHASRPGPHGPAQVERDIDGAAQGRTDDATPQADWRTGIEALREQARDLVDRNLLLFARGETEKFREELLKSARLSNLERRDLDRMRVLVRAMAKRWPRATPSRADAGCAGSSTYAARSVATWAGAAFRSSPCGSRSGSKSRACWCCATCPARSPPMAQFLLMFLYALNEALADIRRLRLCRQPDRGQRHPGSRTDRNRDRQDHAA